MKKFAIYLVLLFTFTGFPELMAQKELVRENFYDAEFFLSEEEYNEALYSYQKVYKAGYQENANINYRIGICYMNIPGEKIKAIPYLEKSIKNISENYKEGSYTETFAPKDALLYLGNAYRISYQLDKAIESYDNYLKLAVKASPVDIEFARQQIESCKLAKEAIKNPAPILKKNLGENYNSSLNNFQCVFSGDNSTMAYMTAQKFYDAVYFVKKIDSTWSNSINITPQLESDGDQYVSSLSWDGTKLFLVRINNFDGDIMVSDYVADRWTPSRPIGKPVNSKYFESHASLSPNGKTLYFTSNRTGGFGGMDIYTSNLLETGAWSEPVNLGDVINTPLNEETPFLASDGKTLYFSSQGHSTIGGYDIFTSELQDNKSWSTPKALPYPINTTDDDLFFFPDVQNNGGYMALYQDDGFGDGDLYYVKIISPEEALAALKPAAEDSVKVQVVKEPVVVVEEPKTPSLKYVIKPVFFGFDSYSLTAPAQEKLNEIVKALGDYPKLSLEIRGYTDDQGPFEYNQILSEKRAKSVADYLINKGIAANRLKTTGFSKSGNVAINTFPDGRGSIEGRKLNRRVEFRIVELGGALLLIEEIPVPEHLKLK